MKPLITQISNRYQLLHVLSKEVVSKWQGIIEDHDNFDTHYENTKKWLRGVDEAMTSIQKEPNVEKKLVELQNICAEHEQGALKLSNLASLGERLFPDTGSQGREAIRNEMKMLR